jgi:murein DD-endopeptidase MepM/ murein hydrolase activator NlpD
MANQHTGVYSARSAGHSNSFELCTFMSQKRVVLTTLFVTSVLIPFIHLAQISLPLSSTAFRLPIAPGLNLYVSQGNNDTQHDHVGKAAWAFDFIVGQTNFVVTAAQGGKVIGADDSSSIQCSGLNTESVPEQKFLQDCWTYANHVLIANDEGTTAALYMHLLPHSLKVSSAMHVNQGDTLGLAGTTGWSTGVHLHFQVEDIPSAAAQQQHYPGWWWTQSLPVSFSNPEVLAQQQSSDGVPKEDQSFSLSGTITNIPVR